MRTWRRLGGDEPDEGLDPAVAELLPAGRFEGEIDAFHLARARARVDARLHEQGSNRRWLGRLAAGGAGGTSMWVGLVGAAAAHKAAAAAVGLSILVGGTVAVETGVGPAVSDQVQAAFKGSRDEEAASGHAAAAASRSATPTPGAAGTATATAAARGAAVEPAEDAPGNLVAHVAPNGSFQLRGVIVEGDDDTLTVATAGGEVEVDISEARIVWMGKRGDEIDWDELEGYLVVVGGSCEGDAEAGAVGDCDTLVAEHVQVLGRAGQQGSGATQQGKPEDEERGSGRAAGPQGNGAQARGEQEATATATATQTPTPTPTPTRAAPTPRRGGGRD